MQKTHAWLSVVGWVASGLVACSNTHPQAPQMSEQTPDNGEDNNAEPQIEDPAEEQPSFDLGGWTPWTVRGKPQIEIPNAGQFRVFGQDFVGGFYRSFAVQPGEDISLSGIWRVDAAGTQLSAQVFMILGDELPKYGEDIEATNSKLLFANNAADIAWNERIVTSREGAIIANAATVTVVLRVENPSAELAGVLFSELRFQHAVPLSEELLQNGNFAEGMKHWHVWQHRGQIEAEVDASGRLFVQGENINGGVYQQFQTGGLERTLHVSGQWATLNTLADAQWAEVLLITNDRVPTDSVDVMEGQDDVVLLFKKDTWQHPQGWSGDFNTAADVAQVSVVVPGPVATLVLKTGNLEMKSGGILFDDVVVRAETPHIEDHNLLVNGSFEGSWHHPGGIPELQIPADWNFYFEEGATGFGSEPWDVWVRPEVRVLPSDFLPMSEQTLFILDGDQTVKLFKGYGAISCSLDQELELEAGEYEMTVNVYPDLVVRYQNGQKVFADVDAHPGEIRFIAPGEETAWLNMTPGQWNRVQHRFTVSTAGKIQIGLAIRGRFALPNNGWFTDHWRLRKVEF